MTAELELVENPHDTGSEGTVIVRKVAGSDDERRRFAHEATMLKRASHPGVVELLDFDAETATLRTQFVSDQTWQSAPPDTLANLARGIASVAGTLQDLHDLAITHGAISLEHIIVGPGGRPILCDLSYASDADPGFDIEALGVVINQCLENIPEGKASSRRALSSLATRATDADIARRPTAAAIATAAKQLAEPASATSKERRKPRPRVLAGAAALVGALALLLWPSGQEPLRIATLDDAISVPATTVAASASTSFAPTTSASTSPPTTDAAPEPLVLEHDGFRYAVGRSGDSSAIGDWDCDGDQTAAILRPHSGQVYLFQNWPDDQEVATVTPLTIPNSTARLEAGANCGRLVLIDADGDSVTLAVEHASDGA